MSDNAASALVYGCFVGGATIASCLNNCFRLLCASEFCLLVRRFPYDRAPASTGLAGVSVLVLFSRLASLVMEGESEGNVVWYGVTRSIVLAEYVEYDLLARDGSGRTGRVDTTAPTELGECMSEGRVLLSPAIDDLLSCVWYAVVDAPLRLP